MLNFSSLYSGSTGNSLFLQSDNSKVLIDSGVSANFPKNTIFLFMQQKKLLMQCLNKQKK